MRNIIIVLVVICLSPVLFFPNYSLEAKGNTLFPVNSKQIVMESEDISIEAKNNNYNVECNYVFSNTGSDIDLVAGFPYYLNKDVKDKLVLPIKNFTVYVNGVESAIEYKDLKNSKFKEIYNMAYLFNANFKKSERKNIKITYSFLGASLSQDIVGFEYILNTGALWGGKIDNINIKIKGINPLSIATIIPEGWEYKDNMISWSFKEIGPKDDIKIQYAFQLSEWLDFADIELKKKENSDVAIQNLINRLLELIECSSLGQIKRDFVDVAIQLINKTSKNFPKEKYITLVKTCKIK